MTVISKSPKQFQKQFQKDLQEILTQVKEYYPNFGKEGEKKLTHAFWFAKEAHQDQARYSGEPYFIHPVGATKILLSIKPDLETIIACLLHDVIEDTPITEEEIEKEFGKRVRFLCEGVAKVSKVQMRGEERRANGLRRLFIAMAQDIRVIFIKLADRIHNLQTLQHVRPDKQARIARESLEVYAPVAEKLGLFEFKSQIEDLCFKILATDEYNQICKVVSDSLNERKQFIEDSIEEIQKVFKTQRVKIISIKGRPKNLYSVNQKMRRKNIGDIGEVYDLFAIRILVGNKNDCYQALGIIHSLWKPLSSRFKDYIAVPKPNGYQSLHTTVLGMVRSNLPTEIQIKTPQMHLDAEYGPAAHWAYKKARSSNFDENYVRKMSWIPEDVAIGQESQDPEKFFKNLVGSIQQDRIHVFTPKGELKNLPSKATPVDFAYAIHTQIGHSCIGAKVNGIIKPLDYELQVGDVIEIITKQGRQPNTAWLNFVKSSGARGHIKAHVNRIKRQERETTGKKIEAPQKLITKQKTSQKKSPKLSTTGKEILGEYDVIIGGEEGMSYRLASCCKPRPGKNIIAYNTRGMDFTIHTAVCKVAKHLDPDRFLEAHFILQRKIMILAKDRRGLMRDYSDTISRKGIFIWDVRFRRRKNNIAVWNFIVNVPSDKEFDELIRDIKKLPNVTDVIRKDQKTMKK